MDKVRAAYNDRLIANGFTQEQVGKIIGVTTQAVSKWERGSTPDAEILPGIADALGVSVDALYGREERSFAVQIAKKLCKMQQDEAYRYAFGICWAIEIGLSGEASAIDDLILWTGLSTALLRRTRSLRTTLPS